MRKPDSRGGKRRFLRVFLILEIFLFCKNKNLVREVKSKIDEENEIILMQQFASSSSSSADLLGEF